MISVVARRSDDREAPGGSCAAGQLIDITEWGAPLPEPTAHNGAYLTAPDELSEEWT
jgi:hypothetical protein